MLTATKKDQRYTLIHETTNIMPLSKKLLRFCTLILSIILEGFVLHFFYKHGLFNEPMLPAIFLTPVLIIILSNLNSKLGGGIYLYFRRLELVVKLFFHLSIAMLILKMLLTPSVQGLFGSLRITGVCTLALSLLMTLSYMLKVFENDYSCKIKFTGNFLELVKDLRSVGLNLAKKEDNLAYFHIGRWSILNHECIVHDCGEHQVLLVDNCLKNKLGRKDYA